MIGGPRHRRRWAAGPAAAVCVVALCATPASAQTSLQIPLQFDFVNPGAKSMALGGAFAGLADDATATFANPAGLKRLERTELSIELRGTWTSTKFLERGRLSGPVSNQGEDVIAGAIFGESSDSRFAPGFLSVVYVPRPESPWRLAGYRHELVRVDQSFLSQGVFQQDPADTQSSRDRPQEGLREVSITGYGISGAYEVLRDRLNVGATLGIYTMHLDSQFRRFATLGGFDGPPDFDRVVGVGTQVGDDVAVAPTLGALWTLRVGKSADPQKPPKLTLPIGVVYRRGPSLAFGTTSNDEPPTDSRFRVPDVLAVGTAWVRPFTTPDGGVTATLTLAGEVTWVNYSRLREDFVTDQAQGSERVEDFFIEDGVEVHVGVQYAKPDWKFRPRFRGGFWFDPDHSVQFSPVVPSQTSTDRLFDERLSTALSTGKDQFHVTGGIGVTLSSHFELNAGVDLSPTSRLFSTSVIVR